MSVLYELYIKVGKDREPLSRKRVLEVLSSCQFEPAEGALGQIDLGHGKLKAVEHTGSDWDRAVETSDQDSEQEPADELKGVDFSFPFGLPDVEGELAITQILNVNELLLANLFDPQVGSLVTHSDHDRISQAWHESHEYHFGIAGTPGLGSGMPGYSPATQPGIPTKYKIMAVIAGAMLLVIMMVRSCLKRWLDTEMDPPPPISQSSDAGTQPKKTTAK
ncbi:MAG: hypothetical protein JRJ19_06965 [Deltaproteobacteria bacterium]|nr:hypothetical protein [Deltaproteobacteria bacterium]